MIKHAFSMHSVVLARSILGVGQPVSGLSHAADARDPTVEEQQRALLALARLIVERRFPPVCVREPSGG